MTQDQVSTMSAQQVFDTVVNHLRTQGRRALDDADGTCMYRAPNGDKCAAGILIPDELYHPSMEGASLSKLINGGDEVIVQLFGQNLPLVEALQTVHDSNNFLYFETGFLKVASNFHLTYTPPTA